jgi:drug/metabolite transporter (DMT)-like permease
MTQKQAEWLLLLTIAARSMSYLLSKIGLSTLPPLELLAIRFFLAFFILCLLFRHRLSKVTKEELKAGIILGTALFTCMACELISLTTIDSSMAAFLENSAIVWVLLIQAVLLRTMPNKRTVGATGLILFGIALLTLHGAAPSLSIGEIICLSGSFCYAIWIILTGKYARSMDPFNLGIIQMGIMASLSLISSALMEPMVLPVEPITWEAILGLTLICTVFGFTFQTVAQRYASAAKAGIFTAINPLIAAVLGCLILSESFGIAQMIGGACIIGSILLIQTQKEKPAQARHRHIPMICQTAKH